MTKKNYLIIGATILFFLVVIIVILLLNNKETWATDILEADSYQMAIIDCNGGEKTLDNNALNELIEMWNTLSDNGPWTSEGCGCYRTLTITYEKEGIIKYKDIILVDDTSIVLDLGTSTTYYTNAQEIIQYLNALIIV